MRKPAYLALAALTVLPVAPVDAEFRVLSGADRPGEIRGERLR